MQVPQQQARANPSVVLATAGYDHTVRFWEAPTGICYRTIQFPDSQVNKLQVTPDKRFIVVAGNPHIRMYDVKSGAANPVMNFDGHTHNVTAVGFHKDAKWMFTGSQDGTVKVWDLRAPGCQREYESKAPVNSVALHPNQGELISGDENGVIRVWDLLANSCARQLIPSGKIPIRSLSAAGDGSIAVAANNKGNCFVWPLAPPPLEGVAAGASAGAGAGAGGAGAGAGEGEGEGNAQTFVHTFQAHNAYVLNCCLSPDSKLLATTSSDKLVRIWNVPDFSLHSTLQAHQRWVWDCVFSADSAYIVTGSSDNSARLWDVAQGDTIQSYNGHNKAVIAVAMNDAAP